jgi:hypothetical protein
MILNGFLYLEQIDFDYARENRSICVADQNHGLTVPFRFWGRLVKSNRPLSVGIREPSAYISLDGARQTIRNG